MMGGEKQMSSSLPVKDTFRQRNRPEIIFRLLFYPGLLKYTMGKRAIEAILIFFALEADIDYSYQTRATAN